METENKMKSKFRYNRKNAIIDFIAFCILALNVDNSDLQLTLNIVGGTILVLSIIIGCIGYKKPNVVKLSLKETTCMWIFYTLVIVAGFYHINSGAYPMYVNVIIALFCLTGVTYFALTPPSTRIESSTAN